MRNPCRCGRKAFVTNESVCLDGIIVVPDHLVSPACVDDIRIDVSCIRTTGFHTSVRIEARAKVIVKYVGLNHQLYVLCDETEITVCVELNCPVNLLSLDVKAKVSSPQTSLVPSPSPQPECSPERFNIAFRAIVIFEVIGEVKNHLCESCSVSAPCLGQQQR